MGGFCFSKRILEMNIFIYSDESGVFDKVHNKYFVFGGIMFLSKDERDNFNRKYIHAENVIRSSESIASSTEVKAVNVSNKSKGKLFRSMNNIHKFGVIIQQGRLLDSIFLNKKSKQRYLDYAYKIAVKRKFEDMIKLGILNPEEVTGLYFFVDEHTTATDGLYELKEALEQEYKYGTHNFKYTTYYPPIFPNLKNLDVSFCNSESKTLVRAADIVANRLYYLCTTNSDLTDIVSDKFYIGKLP